MSYLCFAELRYPDHRTKLFEVRNSVNMSLGMIKFKPAWRKYVFEPYADSVFDTDCMIEIATFMKDQTATWRASL